MSDTFQAYQDRVADFQEKLKFIDVEQMLSAAGAMAWAKAEAVGEGDDYRAESGAEVHASALTFQESPVHLSVVVAQ